MMTDAFQTPDGTIRVCKDCGVQYLFESGEQRFYDRLWYQPPVRCRQCRDIRKQQRGGMAAE